MAITRKAEEALLSGEELQIVVKTRHPEIRQVPNGELAGLRSQLRDRRDAARQLAARQRSEVRGKGRGGEDREDAGIQKRLAALSKAMQRLNREFDRRARGRGLGEMMDDMWDTVSGEEELEEENKTPKRKKAKAAGTKEASA